MLFSLISALNHEISFKVTPLLYQVISYDDQWPWDAILTEHDDLDLDLMYLPSTMTLTLRCCTYRARWPWHWDAVLTEHDDLDIWDVQSRTGCPDVECRFRRRPSAPWRWSVTSCCIPCRRWCVGIPVASDPRRPSGPGAVVRRRTVPPRRRTPRRAVRAGRSTGPPGRTAASPPRSVYRWKYKQTRAYQFGKH